MKHAQKTVYSDKSWLNACVALLAGAGLALAFAPFQLSLLASLSPMVLLYLCLRTSPKRALLYGWLFGLGLFGVGVSWVYISIHYYGNTPAPLAALFSGFFIAFLALFPALQTYLYVRFFRHNHVASVLGFPCLWVLSEYLRSTVLTGFPWLLLGYSQQHTPLGGFIPVLGDHGLSFIVVLSAALLLHALQHRPYRYLLLALLASLWWCGWLLAKITWTHATGRPLQVSLLQGNIAQELKWNPQQLNNTVATYRQLTSQHWDSDLIVWPESALPIPLYDARTFIQRLSRDAQRHHSALLLGSIDYANMAQTRYYTGLLALGTAQGYYRKRHLVPFGEYVPLEKWLRGMIQFLDIPMSNFIPGPTQQPLLRLHDVAIAAAVCYEVAYADTLWQNLPTAQLLVTVSNDAWFQDSFALAQHVQIAQFRARQAGRYLLFSTNDGITAIINPQGQIQDRLPIHQRAVLTAKVYPMQGATPWTHIGNTLSLALIACLTALLLLTKRRPSEELPP